MMMRQIERVAMQRSLAREAIGKLRAVSEWFGVEDERLPSTDDLNAWDAKLDAFERWVWDESPIA
jgi:hypothetical protein